MSVIQRLRGRPFDPVLKDGVRIQIKLGSLSGRYMVFAMRPRDRPPARGRKVLTYSEWFDSLPAAVEHVESLLRRPRLRMKDLVAIEERANQASLAAAREIVAELMLRKVGARRVGVDSWLKPSFNLNVSIFPRVSGLLEKLELVVRDNKSGREYVVPLGFISTDRAPALLARKKEIKDEVERILKALYLGRLVRETLDDAERWNAQRLLAGTYPGGGRRRLKRQFGGDE